MTSNPPSSPREAQQVADRRPYNPESEDGQTPEPESSRTADPPNKDHKDHEKTDMPRDQEDSHEPAQSRESGEASSSPPQSSMKKTPAEGEDAAGSSPDAPASAPPLPDEPPPLPNEHPPPQEDDGWDFHWDAQHQAYFFYNRFTGATQWENPRIPSASATATATTAGDQPLQQPAAAPPPPPTAGPVAGGYNPAIHGDYDPNAWYAQAATEQDDEEAARLQQQQQLAVMADPSAAASFNRFTGFYQAPGEGPERHSDEAKSRRQLHAYFDVDAAANAHDGRSLKAERSGKKISKAELKHFKEKRRARKEEKRRAWLRD